MSTETTETAAEISKNHDAEVYKAMYEEQRQKSEQLEGIVAAQRAAASQSTRAEDHKPAVSAERAKALVGELTWNHKYTEADKLRAIGVTTPVDKAEISRIFGRGADSRLASELHKTSRSAYLMKREIALALDLYAK